MDEVWFGKEFRFSEHRDAVRLRRDPWRGRQPRYKRMVRLTNGGMALEANLPSGEPVIVPLSGCAPPRSDANVQR